LKTAWIFGCCLLMLPLAGAVRRSGPNSRAQTLPGDPSMAAQAKIARQALRAGAEAFRSGGYTAALTCYETARRAALAAGETDLAARATGNLGGCQFALHQYRPAITRFLEARKLAQRAGDASAIAAFDANIASLYSEMGELEAAAQWTEASLTRMTGRDRQDHLPKILIQLATLRARQNRMQEALGLFARGIALADAGGDTDLYALGWNRLGEELLKRGRAVEAEGALLEAYRIRKLHHLPLDSSYRNLGRLRLEQGDFAAAETLLDRAVELAREPRGLMPTWDVYHYRGRVRMARGRLREALEDLRIAARLARAWRWSAPAGDTAARGAEGWLAQVDSALIEAGGRLYLETGDPALARVTFEAEEENRSGSLRALAARGGPGDMPAGYWEALARLQHAEIDALRSGGAAAAVETARAELTRLESGAGAAAAPPSGQLTERTRQALDGHSALLSFHLGDDSSWLWAVDRGSLALYRLPGRAAIDACAQRFRQAVRDDLPEAGEEGALLGRLLFGAVEPRFLAKERWLVALDDALYDVPLAVLPDPGRKGSYAVEARELTLIPGAAYWLDAVGRVAAPVSSSFLGIGDPIYNRADPRWRPRARDAGFAPPSSAPIPAAWPELALPRLAASGAELEACGRAWPGSAVLLTGAGARRAKIGERLRDDPAVVHFATHMVDGPDPNGGARIALSLDEQGRTELLGPDEIAALHTRARMVVLSGCHSAAGAVLPGTGLIGLTRAWLAAGARSVAASRWDVPDDDGALFRAAYENLRRPGVSPSGALRLAQLQMLHSADSRSRPRYWGAYLLIGSE
jgi:tetratricopeptide (TPR) repeat protein